MVGDDRTRNVWIWVKAGRDGVGEETLGLIAEARKLLSTGTSPGTVTAVAQGGALPVEELERLGNYGADRVVRIPDGPEKAFPAEYAALALARLMSASPPCLFLLAQDGDTADLAARLAALLEAPLITRAVDLGWAGDNGAVAVRPISNGYLFEERTFSCAQTAVVCFLPQVLDHPESGKGEAAEIVEPHVPDFSGDLTVRVLEELETDPGNLAVDEADIVVSGGRGIGKGRTFDLVHDLARALGGSVGGTRPVIDLQILPFERQIGQTGKTVAPRLLVACGISGANEYTAGMEKSQRVVAVNTDPRARIFRFADLGVVGDAQEIVPRLIARIKERREGKS